MDHGLGDVLALDKTSFLITVGQLEEEDQEKYTNAIQEYLIEFTIEENLNRNWNFILRKYRIHESQKIMDN